MDNEKIASELIEMAQSLTAANKGRWDYMPGGFIEIEGASDAMARSFGVKSDDFELYKIGNKLWGAYDGEKMTLFTNKEFYSPEDWDY